MPSFDVSVQCVTGFTGNPKAFACDTEPVVTRVKVVGNCGARRVRSRAYPASHGEVFHAVRKFRGGWDYRQCAVLLRQETHCSQEWFEVDAQGHCLCVPVDNNCSAQSLRENGGTAPHTTPSPGGAERYHSTAAAYRVSGCEPITCDGRSVKPGGHDAVVGRGHSAVLDDRVSTGRKAPDQPFLSTLVYPCALGFHPGNVTYTCTRDGAFATTETCSPISCTQPQTEGYDFSDAIFDRRSLEVPTFAVTGVRCAPGYASDNPTASPCDAQHGGEYRVSGCTPVPCPERSFGPSVPAGCTCKNAQTGVVLPMTDFPFYASTCAG